MAIPEQFKDVGHEPDKFKDPKGHDAWERGMRQAKTAARSNVANQARAGRAFRRALRNGDPWAVTMQGEGKGIVGPGIQDHDDFNAQVEATVQAKATDDKAAEKKRQEMMALGKEKQGEGVKVADGVGQMGAEDPINLDGVGELPPEREDPADAVDRREGEAERFEEQGKRQVSGDRIDLTGQTVGRAQGALAQERQKFADDLHGAEGLQDDEARSEQVKKEASRLGISDEALETFLGTNGINLFEAPEAPPEAPKPEKVIPGQAEFEAKGDEIRGDVERFLAREETREAARQERDEANRNQAQTNAGDRKAERDAIQTEKEERAAARKATREEDLKNEFDRDRREFDLDQETETFEQRRSDAQRSRKIRDEKVDLFADSAKKFGSDVREEVSEASKKALDAAEFIGGKVDAGWDSFMKFRSKTSKRPKKTFTGRDHPIDRVPTSGQTILTAPTS